MNVKGVKRRPSIPGLSTWRRLGVDLATDSDSIFLLSSGRSGSTWLGDMLQTLGAMRVIFEPFHPRHGLPELRHVRYTYLAANAGQAGLFTALRGLLDGRRRTNWTEQFNWGRWMYRRRLLKAVRANLLSPWLQAAFPDCRHLLLIRHPMAVVSSQLRGGWVLSSRRLRDQADLADVVDMRGLDQFGWPEDGFLSNLLFWAIENAVALDAARRTGALVLFYEDLCLHPDREIARLGDYLGVEFPARIRARLDRSSWSSDRRVGALSAEEKTARWMRDARDEQLGILIEVMDACQLGGLYGRDPLPDHAALMRGFA